MDNNNTIGAEDYSPTPLAKQKKVVEKSVAWNHCTKYPEEHTVYCNHCDKFWKWNNSSTSNYLRHTISKHYDKLSPEERQSLESREAVNCSEDQELNDYKREVVQRSIIKYTIKYSDCVLSHCNPMTKTRSTSRSMDCQLS